MHYGEVIERSFRIVWRFKYLWLLGILGGADVGGGGGVGGNFSFGNGGRGASGAGGRAAAYVQDHAGLLIGLGAALLLLALVYALVACVSTGALVRAAAEHDAGRPFGFRDAWRAGLARFWAVLGLRLLLLALALVLALVVLILVITGVVAAQNGAGGTVALVVVLGILFVLALIPLAIVVGLVAILATRAIVLEGLGPVAAIGRALTLFGRRLGRVLLTWVIQVAVGIGTGIGTAVVLAVLALPEVIAGVAALQTGQPAAGIPLLVAGTLVAIVAGLIVGGAVGSYFSTYWTLAFRRLDLEPAPQPYAPYPLRPGA